MSVIHFTNYPCLKLFQGLKLKKRYIMAKLKFLFISFLLVTLHVWNKIAPRFDIYDAISLIFQMFIWFHYFRIMPWQIIQWNYGLYEFCDNIEVLLLWLTRDILSFVVRLQLATIHIKMFHPFMHISYDWQNGTTYHKICTPFEFCRVCLFHPYSLGLLGARIWLFQCQWKKHWEYR